MNCAYLYLLMLSLFHLTQAQPSKSTASLKCGQRFVNFASNSSGIVEGREEDPTKLSAPTKVSLEMTMWT